MVSTTTGTGLGLFGLCSAGMFRGASLLIRLPSVLLVPDALLRLARDNNGLGSYSAKTSLN
jgi:hypothetical protein